MAVKVAVDHGKHGRKSIPVLAGWMSALYVEPDSAEQHVRYMGHERRSCGHTRDASRTLVLRELRWWSASLSDTV